MTETQQLKELIEKITGFKKGDHAWIKSFFMNAERVEVLGVTVTVDGNGVFFNAIVKDKYDEFETPLKYLFKAKKECLKSKGEENNEEEK